MQNKEKKINKSPPKKKVKKRRIDKKKFIDKDDEKRDELKLKDLEPYIGQTINNIEILRFRKGLIVGRCNDCKKIRRFTREEFEDKISKVYCFCSRKYNYEKDGKDLARITTKTRYIDEKDYIRYITAKKTEFIIDKCDYWVMKQQSWDVKDDVLKTAKSPKIPLERVILDDEITAMAEKLNVNKRRIGVEKYKKGNDYRRSNLHLFLRNATFKDTKIVAGEVDIDNW